MKSLREQIMDRAESLNSKSAASASEERIRSSIPDAPFLRDRIIGYSWGIHDLTKHNRPLIERLADCAEALTLRQMHDDDCTESTEKFGTNEMCECGASVAKTVLAALRKELE